MPDVHLYTTMIPVHPGGFHLIVADEHGLVAALIEAKDATSEITVVGNIALAHAAVQRIVKAAALHCHLATDPGAAWQCTKAPGHEGPCTLIREPAEGEATTIPQPDAPHAVL